MDTPTTLLNVAAELLFAILRLPYCLHKRRRQEVTFLYAGAFSLLPLALKDKNPLLFLQLGLLLALLLRGLCESRGASGGGAGG